MYNTKNVTAGVPLTRNVGAINFTPQPNLEMELENYKAKSNELEKDNEILRQRLREYGVESEGLAERNEQLGKGYEMLWQRLQDCMAKLQEYGAINDQLVKVNNILWQWYMTSSITTYPPTENLQVESMECKEMWDSEEY